MTARLEVLTNEIVRLANSLWGPGAGDRILNEVGSTPVENRFPLLKKTAEVLYFRAMGDVNLKPLSSCLKYKCEPVGIETFLLDPYYLSLKGQVYDEVLREIKELNSGNYVEAVLTGAIGTAKTTIAIWTTAYQVYLLSLLKDPQKTYGLDRASEILLIFQSLNKDKATKLNYGRFRALIQSSPYFNEEFPFDRSLESELVFPNRIIVRPVSGSATAAIGENVIGGIIDELNFMAITENSKNDIDGGVYDQAVAVYNSIARRRKSRFMSQGKMPGILCLVSSKRYPGQFTDQKEQEALTDKTIYIYDKRLWDVKPKAFEGSDWIKIFIGDQTRPPRILKAGEEDTLPEADKHLVDSIPMEFMPEFQRDIMSALRDIAGISTMALHPFIMQTDKIGECMDGESILTRDKTDFRDLKVAVKKTKIENPSSPRWVHIDLALTGDSAGVAMGYVPEFVRMERGDHVEVMPKVKMDFTLEVAPPRGGEIVFEKIRELLYVLRDKLHVNIKWVTLDSYQSVDTIQILRSKGFTCATLSMDTSMEPYEITKQALYDCRISMGQHDKLQKELASLERDFKKGKIDHPATGSKDVADALAGVVYGLTTRTEIWLSHGIPPINIPRLVSDSKKVD